MDRHSLELTQLPVEDGSSSQTTIRDLSEGLFRHLRVFLIVSGIAFALTLYWTFGTAKRYTSEMVLLVQNARGNEIISPGQNPVASAPDVTEEQLNSEIAVLNSNDLLDELVDPDWVGRPKAEITREEMLRHDRLVNGLKARLDVSAIRSSHAIEVKLTTSSPEEGQRTLTALLHAFLEKQTQLGRAPGSTKFFSDQADRYEEALRLARQELADYQEQHGFVSLDSHEAILAQKLSDVNSGLQSNEVEMSAIRRLVESDSASLASIDKRISTTEKVGPASGAIDELNSRLVAQKNKLTELLTIYKPDDRLVKQLKEEIAETEDGIARASKPESREMSTDINPIWEETQQRLTTNRSKLGSLSAVHSVLVNQAAALRSELDGSESLSPAFEALRQKIDDLQNGYKSVLEKRDAAVMADLMDRQQWMNVAVVESPTLGLTPTHPRPVQDLTIGALTSVLLGLVIVFMAESGRRTASTAAELERMSGYPVLAVVPLEHQERKRSSFDVPSRSSQDALGARAEITHG